MLSWSQLVALAPAERTGREREPAWSVTHHESSLLLRRLEPAVPKLGSGVNEFEFDVFLSPAARVHQKGLEKRSHNTSGLSLQKI